MIANIYHSLQKVSDSQLNVLDGNRKKTRNNNEKDYLFWCQFASLYLLACLLTYLLTESELPFLPSMSVYVSYVFIYSVYFRCRAVD